MGIRSTQPLFLKSALEKKMFQFHSPAILELEKMTLYSLSGKVCWPEHLYGHFGEENILAFDCDRITASRMCSPYSS